MALNDDELLAPSSKKKRMTRSALARKVLRNAVKQVNADLLEKKHKQGYVQHPAGKEEFSVWEAEQEWGDA